MVVQVHRLKYLMMTEIEFPIAFPIHLYLEYSRPTFQVQLDKLPVLSSEIP